MMKLIIHTLFSQEFTLTIEWKMSNLLTSVANTGCLLWNTCAAQGIFTFLLHLLHNMNLIILDVRNMPFHHMTHNQVQVKDS